MPSIVIIGGGTAGCVLANRLSRNSRYNVVMLEAGPDFPDSYTLPSDLSNGTVNSYQRHDWQLKHRPSPGQIKFPLPRGRVVGGSSAVNTCIALRGEPQDYNEWSLPEWEWAHCLRNFKKLENDLDFDSLPQKQYHGQAGPLLVRRHSYDELSNWSAGFLQACATHGFPVCADFNAPQAVGAGAMPMNKVAGRRISAAEAYLPPSVRNRSNLRIVPYAQAYRLRLSGHKVTAVEFVDSRRPRGVVQSMGGDVFILAAGAIHSPGILMRSGIGHPEKLRRMNVAIKHKLPGVAGQLLDHPGFALFYRRKKGSGAHPKDPIIQTALRFGSNTGTLKNDVLIQPGARIMAPMGTMAGFSIMAMIGKPESTGTLDYHTNNPFERPEIHSNFLTRGSDKDEARRLLQVAYEIGLTNPMNKMGTLLYPRASTVINSAKLAQKAAFICDSGYHPSGTVPMGKPDDPRACCDATGHIFGIDNLQVADASLMPTIPVANINLTVMMMAERLAELRLLGHK